MVRRETWNEALQVLRGKRPLTVANPGVLEKVTLERRRLAPPRSGD